MIPAGASAPAGFASSCSFPCILYGEVRYGNRITGNGTVQTAVCGVDIFWYICGEALKHKEKIDVEKSVGNVDNSLKTRLRFPAQTPSTGFGGGNYGKSMRKSVENEARIFGKIRT